MDNTSYPTDLPEKVKTLESQLLSVAQLLNRTVAVLQGAVADINRLKQEDTGVHHGFTKEPTPLELLAQKYHGDIEWIWDKKIG